jgi:hypothetical protein
MSGANIALRAAWLLGSGAVTDKAAFGKHRFNIVGTGQEPPSGVRSGDQRRPRLVRKEGGVVAQFVSGAGRGRSARRRRSWSSLAVRAGWGRRICGQHLLRCGHGRDHPLARTVKGARRDALREAPTLDAGPLLVDVFSPRPLLQPRQVAGLGAQQEMTTAWQPEQAAKLVR